VETSFLGTLIKHLPDYKSVHHSLMKGLMWKGGAHAASQLAFIVSLNKPC
jgi:hypothetical protein